VSTNYLYGYVEDAPSSEIAKRILAHVNKEATSAFEFKEGFPKIENGFGAIKKKVPALKEMAENGIFSLVITDLDTAECPPSLIKQWCGDSGGDNLSLPLGLIFRVAVREIESWILADREALSGFLGIPAANFEASPDDLSDPKQHLMNVLRKKGRKKWHREMVPKTASASIGPLYNEKLCRFVRNDWDPGRAQVRSPSLKRSIQAFKKVCAL